jgi:hypothetical protein
METGPEIGSEVFAFARLDDIDVPKPHALDDAQPFMLGRREHCPDCVLEPLGESLESFVGGSLQDDTVLRHQNTPGLVSGSVLPPFLLDHLNGNPCAQAEVDLLNLAGALDRKAVLAKNLLNLRDVPVYLTDGTESNLAQHQRQGLLRQGHIPAPALHDLLLLPFTVNLTLDSFIRNILDSIAGFVRSPSIDTPG